MANKKINCPKCRRLYDKTIKFCPYCGEENPLMQEGVEQEEEQEEPLKKQGPKIEKTAKAVQRKSPVVVPKEPEPVEEPEEEEYDDSEYAEDYTDDEYDDSEGFYADENVDEEEYEDDDEAGDEEYEDEESEEYDSDEEYEEEDEESEEYEDDDYEEQGNSELTEEEKRIPIDWSDEKKKAPKKVSEEYNENGEYQPNFDGYYNDTKAKIDNEIDNLTAGKEKAIIKVIFGFAAVIGIIVYLVLTI